jgi:hypothetical protein
MVKCFSVRLKSLTQISPICLKATDFNGNECYIPNSQFYGQDYDVAKSDAYWFTAWILSKKSLMYSDKKWTMFSKAGKNLGQIKFKHHIPNTVSGEINYDDSLFK